MSSTMVAGGAAEATAGTVAETGAHPLPSLCTLAFSTPASLIVPAYALLLTRPHARKHSARVSPVSEIFCRLDCQTVHCAALPDAVKRTLSTRHATGVEADTEVPPGATAPPAAAAAALPRAATAAAGGTGAGTATVAETGTAAAAGLLRAATTTAGAAGRCGTGMAAAGMTARRPTRRSIVSGGADRVCLARLSALGSLGCPAAELRSSVVGHALVRERAHSPVDERGFGAGSVFEFPVVQVSCVP